MSVVPKMGYFQRMKIYKTDYFDWQYYSKDSYVTCIKQTISKDKTALGWCFLAVIFKNRVPFSNADLLGYIKCLYSCFVICLIMSAACFSRLTC